jgi:ABC-2 type transport system permease protein
MTTATDRGDPGFLRTTLAYAVSDSLILWRMRTPIVFMLAVPAVLSVTLGQAISGTDSLASRGRSMIGIAVMFSFMTVNYVGLAFFREFSHGTWIRQSVSRPSRLAFLLGKLLPTAFAGVIQLTIFGGVAFAIYHTPLHGSALQLYLVAIPLVLVGCLTGAVLYVFTHTTAAFQSAGYIVLISSGCVGGTIVSYENLPPLSQALGIVTPQHWALRALDEATSGTGSWGSMLQAVGVMAGMCVLLGTIALSQLDYRREKSSL